MVFLRGSLCPGLTEELTEILRTNGVRTVEDLVSSDTEELAQQCSVSYKVLVAVRRVLLAQHAAFPASGADLYEELLSSTAILSTGNPRLDELLDTGVYTGELTELVGTAGSGKTQVCFGLAVNLSCELKQSVLYVDSSGGLSATRLLQMIKTKTSGVEEQMEALQRIQVAQVYDVFSMLECLQNLRSGGPQQVTDMPFLSGIYRGGTLKAVIVDSVTAVLSHILGGKRTDGMSLMMQVAGELKTIARDFNVAVLVTNHVSKDGNGCLKPGLGLSWNHVPRTRILLESTRKPGSEYCIQRTATLIKSSRQRCNITQEFDLNAWDEMEVVPLGSSGKRKLVLIQFRIPRGQAEKPRHSTLKRIQPPPLGIQKIPRPAARYSSSNELGLPVEEYGRRRQGGILANSQTTSTGSSECRGAVTLLEVSPG